MKEEEDAPDDPEVVAPVPAPPEAAARVVVGHAPDHIFRRIDPVHERPETEEPPRDEQLKRSGGGPVRSMQQKGGGEKGVRSHFKPYDHEVQPTHNSQLTRSQPLQSTIGVLDRDDVDVVQEDLHAEERDDEAGEVRHAGF